MKKAIGLSIITTLVVLLLVGCGQPGPSSPAPEAKASPRSGAPTGEAWEQKWAATVLEAKKEGVVSIYSLWTPETKNALTTAFKTKYGIDLEFTAFSRGADLAAKSEAEARAGLYLADAFGPGNTTLLLNMKPVGLLTSIKPLLILPEVLDPKVWLGGNIPFVDKDATALSMVGSVMRGVVYNTTMVKDGEITSYKDLLKPQYKGKIVLNDPSIAGGGSTLFFHLGNNLWGEEESVNFLKKLIKDQEVMVQRDNRLHIEWIARGKYAIGVAPLREIVFQFASVGAPIKFADSVKEENRLTVSTGTLGISSKTPHPKAAIVFANWLLTREGQSIFAPSFGSPSTRMDASTEGIDPLAIPARGEKYYIDSEDEIVIAKSKWQDLAKKVVAEATK